MRYKRLDHSCVIGENNIIVPNDPRNRNYAEYFLERFPTVSKRIVDFLNQELYILVRANYYDQEGTNRDMAEKLMELAKLIKDAD